MKLDESARLYLKDFHVLNEVHNEIGRYLEEIISESIVIIEKRFEEARGLS